MEGATYELAGKWNFGKPELESNKCVVSVVSPVKEEEDPKAKKDPKKPVEEEPEGNPIKIAIDVSNPNEENRALTIQIEVLFQGEPFEDPNPPEEEDPKKKKAGGEPEPRIITPDPILLENESGRLFEFELGRYELIKNEAGDESERAKTPVSGGS